MTPSLDPAPNAEGWNNLPVTVTWLCVDALSGVSTCSDGETLSVEGTGQSSTGVASDVAGNTTVGSTADAISNHHR